MVFCGVNGVDNFKFILRDIVLVVKMIEIDVPKFVCKRASLDGIA